MQDARLPQLLLLLLFVLLLLLLLFNWTLCERAQHLAGDCRDVHSLWCETGSVIDSCLKTDQENLEVIGRDVGECNPWEPIHAMLHRTTLGRHALEAFGPSRPNRVACNGCSVSQWDSQTSRGIKDLHMTGPRWGRRQGRGGSVEVPALALADRVTCSSCQMLCRPAQESWHV